MKAWVLHGINDLRLEERKKPVPGEGEVLLRVRAVGICGSDIPRIYRDGAHRMPLVPGHEFSGETVETGAGVDGKWLHRRVGVFPLIPCRACAACRQERYEMCRNYGYLGSRQDGGFAEYAAVPAENLIPLPENVSYEEAAMLEPMAVAVHAMRRMTIEEGDTVAVCGLGTIGLLLTMFLLQRGDCRVLAIGNKALQKKLAEKLGLPEEDFCDSRTEKAEDWICRRTGETGADVFFECVGRPETYAQAIALTAPGGRVCLVGNPSADMGMKKEVYWKILRNQLTVTGTWNSSFTGKQEDDWHYALGLVEAGKIAPACLISHDLSLEELERGLHVMRDKSEDYVKIMARR